MSKKLNKLWNKPTMTHLMQSIFLTPKALNVNNPVQAVGAARGMENRRQHQNSVGVQHLLATCCAPTEHRVSTLHRSTPSCGYRLARGYSHYTPSVCSTVSRFGVSPKFAQRNTLYFNNLYNIFR